jgi:hypothetical protein
MSKLIILPDCPYCDEPELFSVAGPYIRIRCSYCGFDSGNIAQRKPDMDTQKVVEELFAKYEAAHE